MQTITVKKYVNDVFVLDKELKKCKCIATGEAKTFLIPSEKEVKLLILANKHKAKYKASELFSLPLNYSSNIIIINTPKLPCKVIIKVPKELKNLPRYLLAEYRPLSQTKFSREEYLSRGIDPEGNTHIVKINVNSEIKSDIIFKVLVYFSYREI